MRSLLLCLKPAFLKFLYQGMHIKSVRYKDAVLSRGAYFSDQFSRAALCETSGFGLPRMIQKPLDSPRQIPKPERQP